MQLKAKINQWADRNPKKAQKVEVVAIALTAVVTYSYVCRRLGYRMVIPDSFDEGFVYVKTITGTTLKCEIFPTS